MTPSTPRGLYPPVRLRANKPALWFGLLVCLGLLSVFPLFAVKRPASHDLPQHLAAVHMLRAYPGQGLGAELELNVAGSQYIGFYALAALLSYPFGVLLGTKLLIAVIALAIPLGIWTLLQALGREPRAAFFALPLTLSVPLLFGLYNYMAGIALMLFSLAAAVRLAESYSRRRFITLALLLSLMVLTHLVPALFTLLGCTLVLWDRDYRKVAKNLSSLLPFLLLNIAWLVHAEASRPITEMLTLAPSRTFAHALSDLPLWLSCVLKSQVDELLALAWLLLALVQAGLAFAQRRTASGQWGVFSRRLAWLAPLAWLCYFVLPVKHQWVYPVAPRFAVLAVLLSLLLLPRISERQVTLLCLALTCVVLLQTYSVAAAFRGVQKEEGDIDQAIRRIPEGRRVAALIFNQHSKLVLLSAFRHYSSLYQAEKGGVVSRSFVGFPTSPFAYKDGRRPQEPAWSTRAEDIDPAHDFLSFEYVLVRGGPGRIADSASPFLLLYRGKKWRVYRRSAQVAILK